MRVIAWHERDVMAIEIDDQRANPTPIYIDLKMLRPDRVQSGQHIAQSILDIKDGKLLLTQEFAEPSDVGTPKGDHYCSAVVAVGVTGRGSETMRLCHSATRLTVEGKKGCFTVLIGSDADMDRNKNISKRVMKHLDTAERAGFEELFHANIDWWHEFWSQSFVWTSGLTLRKANFFHCQELGARFRSRCTYSVSLAGNSSFSFRRAR